ncbi:MAG: AbrB/MazE/SpoVT family DNA-binding domain-containing protein [Chloroflexota bacterium]|nr:AbrB/MazE/SpoVT family DNA-binding domain-containing protein [Anaerolineae bacterium]
MATATVSTKGWVVIPKKYREKYGFKPGTKVQFIDYGDFLSIVPGPEDPIEAAYGMLRHLGGPSLTQEIVEEHRQEREREEREIERILRS